MGYATNAAPAGWHDHCFRREWELPVSRRVLWDWLNDPRTFKHGQVWPWRVEFIDAPGDAPGKRGMSPGVLNSHHGPLMSFTGVVGDIIPPQRDDRPAYRDLQYLYGSYAGSLRLVRPTRLQFWLDALSPEQTRLRLQLDSLIYPKMDWLWTNGQKLFWSAFPRWAKRDAPRDAPRHAGRTLKQKT